MIHTKNGNVYAPGIQARASNQHNRVQDGIADGSLTSSELSGLRAMRKDARAELVQAKGDDGKVGPLERRQVHQDLNQISQAIYEFKHN